MVRDRSHLRSVILNPASPDTLRIVSTGVVAADGFPSSATHPIEQAPAKPGTAISERADAAEVTGTNPAGLRASSSEIDSLGLLLRSAEL
jgi:hypothetical protein